MGLPQGEAVDHSTTVGNAASVELLAASSARRLLLIANAHATAKVGISLGTADAAIGSAGTITLGPGERLVLDVAVHRGAVQAIADGAGTPVTCYTLE